MDSIQEQIISKASSQYLVEVPLQQQLQPVCVVWSVSALHIWIEQFFLFVKEL